MSQDLNENKNEICVGPTSEDAGKASSCEGCPNQSVCSSGKYRDESKSEQDEVYECLENVKNVLVILSGKGGVGKSTISSQLAWSLSYYGLNIGILDIDICGPSLAKMMGVENEEVHKSGHGWSPVYKLDNLCIMSVAFMLNNKNDAIIWRGPRKSGLIKQFLTQVEWNELDFLIIDTPPGTSDEHISILQLLKKKLNNKNGNIIIITTPQEISLLDVRKEINFCKKVNSSILGVIENMNGFICPCCNYKSDIFLPTTGGAIKMCEELNECYLGSIPLDPNLLKACDHGQCFIKNTHDDNNPTKQALENLIISICEKFSPDLVEKIKQGKKDINSNNNNNNNNNDDDDDDLDNLD